MYMKVSEVNFIVFTYRSRLLFYVFVVHTILFCFSLSVKFGITQVVLMKGDPYILPTVAYELIVGVTTRH